MNFFLNHWKEFSALGAFFLPLAGIFMSTSNVVEWTKPFGFYIQSRLFINKNNGSQTAQVGNGQVADLLAEFPLRYLDKENWWKYCLPKDSKLKNYETTASTHVGEKDCHLDWWKSHKNFESVSYLLRLMLKFLQLQNQLNLIFLFYADKNDRNSQVSTNGNNQDWISKIKDKCQIPSNQDKESLLKNMFTSSTPISKKCLITPIKVDVFLSLGSESTSQATQTSSSNDYSLDSLKKGTITGKIEYSLSDYLGNLHNFQFNGGSQSSASFSVFPSETYKFKLNGNDGNLNFEQLFDKYQRRELDLKDFNLRQEKK